MDGEPLTDLVAALHQLRRAAGEPSMREIASKIHYSHTTVAKAFKGQQCPTWPILKVIVEYLAGEPKLFFDRWLAVRNHEHPLIGVHEPTQPSAAVDQAAQQMGTSQPVEAISVPHERPPCLTVIDGTQELVFRSEQLAWRYLKMRGGASDG